MSSSLPSSNHFFFLVQGVVMEVEWSGRDEEEKSQSGNYPPKVSYLQMTAAVGIHSIRSKIEHDPVNSAE